MKGSQRARDRRSTGRARQRQQWIIVAVVAVFVIAGIAVIIISQSNATPQVAALPSSPSSPITEEAYPEQSREHILRGAAHPPYSSNPPTSGPHYADKPNMMQVQAGFYDETNAPLDEDTVHAMEHGYVIIYYNCAKAPDIDCNALKSGLKELMDQLGGRKIIAAPRASIDTVIAMASWLKIQRLDSFDVDKITQFYRTHLEQAPEPNVP